MMFVMVFMCMVMMVVVRRSGFCWLANSNGFVRIVANMRGFRKIRMHLYRCHVIWEGGCSILQPQFAMNSLSASTSNEIESVADDPEEG